jgi:hypothetical protein
MQQDTATVVDEYLMQCWLPPLGIPLYFLWLSEALGIDGKRELYSRAIKLPIIHIIFFLLMNCVSFALNVFHLELITIAELSLATTACHYINSSRHVPLSWPVCVVVGVIVVLLSLSCTAVFAMAVLFAVPKQDREAFSFLVSIIRPWVWSGCWSAVVVVHLGALIFVRCKSSRKPEQVINNTINIAEDFNGIVSQQSELANVTVTGNNSTKGSC